MAEKKSALEEIWGRAEKSGEKVLLGEVVVCDAHCGRDYTESDESGGFIFASKAYCPKCAAEAWPNIQRHGEKRYIRAHCPPDQSFADFVREYRGPDAGVQIKHW